MYSMSLALTLVSTWLALEWFLRRRWLWGVAYVAAGWLALHTHYFGGFVLLAQSLFVAMRVWTLPRPWRTLGGWVALQGLLALLYLPWLLPAAAIVTGYGGNGDSPGLILATQRALSVFAVGESAPAAQRVWWAGLAASLLFVGVLRLAHGRPNRSHAAWLLLLYLATPLLATWVSAQSRPIFNERYLVAAAPPFFLLLAAALAPPTQPRWRRGASLASMALVVLLAAGMVASLHRHYNDPAYSKTRGWRALATTLARYSASLPADQVRVAQNFPDPTLWYYYTGPVDHIVLPPAPHDTAGAAATAQALASAGVTRVLLPVQPAANWDDAGIAQAALAGRYRLATTATVGVWPLGLYVAPPAAIRPFDATFANGLQLNGFATQPIAPTAGDLLVLFLAWGRAGATLAGTEVVFAQLLDGAGQLAAQDDRPLAEAAEAEPGLYAIPLPEALPSGVYRLIAGVYDPAQTGAPRIALVTGADHIVLAEIEIRPARFAHPHPR